MKSSIAIIIPALNEAATIALVVEQCRSVRDERFDVPVVVVVDDGSSDRTVECARAAGALVISHRTNRGVGRAFQTGLSRALQFGTDLLVNIDADGQFDPATIPLLVEPILAGRADFTTASRFKDPALVPEMPAIKLWGNRMMSRLIGGIAGQKFYDVSCGFRAYSRDAALRLNLWGDFTYTQESILDLVIKGLRIEEVPLPVRGVREVGDSRVAGNLLKYAVRTSRIIFHSYRDFWPIYFFGNLSLIFLVPGGSLLLFLIVHRFRTGKFTPHIWSGFTGGSLLAFGMIVMATGLIGEMLKRIRLNQEMLLYYERRRLALEEGGARLSLHERENTPPL